MNSDERRCELARRVFFAYFVAVRRTKAARSANLPRWGKPFRNRGAIWNGRIRRVTHSPIQPECIAFSVCYNTLIVLHFVSRLKKVK